jgi:hypothetical protein
LLHQSYYISLKSFKTIKLNSNDAGFISFSAGETERYCFNIDYFPTEEYSPDPNDSTLSIPCKRSFIIIIPGQLLMDTLMFIYFYSNRCGLEVGSVLFHGHCSVGRRRDFLFPRTLCTQETLLHFSIRRHFYPFRYFISIGIILNFDQINFCFNFLFRIVTFTRPGCLRFGFHG